MCSVFDLVFAEGVEAIFRFSVAILKRNEKIICELEFEHLLEFLKNGLYEAYAVRPFPCPRCVLMGVAGGERAGRSGRGTAVPCARVRSRSAPN